MSSNEIEIGMSAQKIKDYCKEHYQYNDKYYHIACKDCMFFCADDWCLIGEEPYGLPKDWRW